MTDVWFPIRGDVIGFLVKEDEVSTGMELDVMVVRDAVGRLWLRWIGNDWYLVGEGKDDKEQVGIGDRIQFTTCKREQLEYAI